MLEPRKADIPGLFLVLVVLPVVLYVLLGRWSETSRRKARISLLAEEAAVESFAEEVMASASVIPPVVTHPSIVHPVVSQQSVVHPVLTQPSVIHLVPPPAAAIRECAICHAPSKTRCSRCKIARYCSGKCQILHWRLGHREECQPPENAESSFMSGSEGDDLAMEYSPSGADPQFLSCQQQQLVHERVQCDEIPSLINHDAGCSTSFTSDCSRIPRPERKTSEKRVSRKLTKEMSDNKDRVATISTDGKLRNFANPNREAYTSHKVRESDFTSSEAGSTKMHGVNGSMISDGQSDWKGTLQQDPGFQGQSKDPSRSTKRQMNASEIGGEYCRSSCSEEVSKRKSFSEEAVGSGSTGSIISGYPESVKQSKSPKSIARSTREQAHSAKVRKGHASYEPGVGTAHGSSGSATTGLMRVIGLKKSPKMSKTDSFNGGIDSGKKVKVLFPYEQFTRFFQYEVFDLAPRGLLNCGNSCYANAVLQCLTCTKPLVTYLLSRTHSRTCSSKNWCLMCELEQHLMMLKEVGGPLSPSRILSHIRSINCQIGDGSQEDAHEFLRLLVASMQAICLEEVGGENQVHPSLQETTFIHQIFGGRLRSLVKCLKCHHESERCENIMDLTLEIFGWVESLEDALTQFTTPEDLDGENMYRCARCASYVRARKQLRIDEAPNILTIVLKRFQEGSYGKINKCITFPEMLDMIPYMTGTNDIPPLYMLYGVVVHVDTLNASFSGHYVSYVKDLQGNWFRIDDSVVQPVHMSQVMSEGAYILFYMRSSPRPPRVYIKKSARQQAAKSLRPSVSRTQNSSDMGHILRSNNRYTQDMEFSDATSSDWSMFTSSDDASFTSESTRDSFSTVDYSDSSNIDPFSSLFRGSYTREQPSQRTISCRMFSGSKPETRYISEQKGYIVDSADLINSVNDVHIGGNLKQDSGYQNFVNYDSSLSDNFYRTFTNCQL